MASCNAMSVKESPAKEERKKNKSLCEDKKNKSVVTSIEVTKTTESAGSRDKMENHLRESLGG